MNRERHYEIKFKYWDSMSNWSERNQSCTVYAENEYLARNKCIELYGLGLDCEYEIVSIKEIV